eukprot:Filipodium_phascolosomae@DN2667_c0_g2_i3.p1
MDEDNLDTILGLGNSSKHEDSHDKSFFPTNTGHHENALLSSGISHRSGNLFPQVSRVREDISTSNQVYEGSQEDPQIRHLIGTIFQEVQLCSRGFQTLHQELKTISNGSSSITHNQIQVMWQKILNESSQMDSLRSQLVELTSQMTKQAHESAHSDEAWLRSERERLQKLQLEMLDSYEKGKEELREEKKRFENEKQATNLRHQAMEHFFRRQEASLRRQKQNLEEETQRVVALKAKTEQSILNGAALVRDSETFAAKKRQDLMVELEVMEEKKLLLDTEQRKVVQERFKLTAEKSLLEKEAERLAQMVYAFRDRRTMVARPLQNIPLSVVSVSPSPLNGYNDLLQDAASMKQWIDSQKRGPCVKGF